MLDVEETINCKFSGKEQVIKSFQNNGKILDITLHTSLQQPKIKRMIIFLHDVVLKIYNTFSKVNYSLQSTNHGL